MKKNLFIPLIVIAMLSISACGSKNTPETSATTETSAAAALSEETENRSELDAIGDVEVEQRLFDVKLEIPADFAGEQTQEELDQLAKENDYKSITLNADGSATYVMTKKQHGEIMKQMAESINTSLSELIGSEDYPNFTNVSTNDTFTEFQITTKSEELDMGESFSVLMFYMYGGMYHIFNGTPVDNVNIKFINADTGTVISESNSKDCGK